MLVFCGCPHPPVPVRSRVCSGRCRWMSTACCAACAPPGGNEPNQGYFVTVVSLGVTLRIFASHSKNKGFRDKTCSSTSTVVGN